MTQWEYLFVFPEEKSFKTLWEGQEGITDCVKKRGVEGWELLGPPTKAYFALIFKRPIANHEGQPAYMLLKNLVDNDMAIDHLYNQGIMSGTAFI